MFPINSIVVAAHLNELMAEAAAERLARSGKVEAQRSNRIAGAVKSVWSTLVGSVDSTGPLPSLAEYPYRG